MIRDKNMTTGLVYGMAVGDAMGYPYRGSNRDDFIKNPISETYTARDEETPAGTWTNATAMTLATIEAIRGGDINCDKIGAELLKWYADGTYSATGKAMNIGASTTRALDRLKGGIKAKNAGGTREPDNGNGSLARSLPLAFILADEKYMFKRRSPICDVSGITHGHARAQISCHILVEYAIQLIMDKDFNEAYDYVAKWVKDFYKSIRFKSEYKHFDRILDHQLNNLGQTDLYASTGYVVDTLEAALWCVITGSDFKDIIMRALSLGGDTCNTAAIAGALAGIKYGYDNIPSEWIEGLQGKAQIDAAIDALSRHTKC